MPTPEISRIRRAGTAVVATLGLLTLNSCGGQEVSAQAPPHIEATTTTSAPETTTTTSTTVPEHVLVPRASRNATTATTLVRMTYPVGCENYRYLFAQYPWPVDQAMFTGGKESGCNPYKVSATDDWGIMQLHGEHIVDPAANIARAYQKWEAGRVGDHNFSAWYAVCTPGNNPQPRYPGIDC